MDFLQKITLLPTSLLEEKEKLEQLRVLENGYKIKVIRSVFDSESVNTEEDFKVLEKLLIGTQMNVFQLPRRVSGKYRP
jgi:3-deoxy-manno-octulosonate cytidylyltransferase (CMP-KDO synthetase)